MKPKKSAFALALLLTLCCLLPTVSAEGWTGYVSTPTPAPTAAPTPTSTQTGNTVVIPEETTGTVSSTSTRTVSSRNVSGLASVKGWQQEKNTKGEGLCTSSAMTTLLRRKQYLDTGVYTYTFSDVRVSVGGKGTPNSKGRYSDASFTFTPKKGWKHTNSDGTVTVYYTKSSTSSDYRKAANLAKMIDKHPEGVGIYVRYASGKYHAIILSDYVKDGSDYTFYAYDPSDKGERYELTDTWLCKKCGSVSKMFKNIKKIFYIDD